MKKHLIILLFGGLTNTQGQVWIPGFESPQPAGVGNFGFGMPQNGGQGQNNGLEALRMQQERRIQEQNERLMRQAAPMRELPPDVLWDIWETEAAGCAAEAYRLPPQKAAGTAAYRSAFDDIAAMLDGKTPLSLKNAVFLTENAWFGGAMPKAGFDRAVKEKADLCLALMKQKRLPDNAHNRKAAIFSLMSDTLKFRHPGMEKTQTHFPYRYDFKDFYGKEDWSSQFVSKLLATKKGQCHSMPLLYLILAQELGAEAYLSTAPEHYYVRIKGKNGDLQNLELTNGMLTSDGDAFILASGFIKAGALRNKIYMDTLGLRDQVAGCLADLAQGYYKKFGFDDFVASCIEKNLSVTPNNIHAIAIKSDYHTIHFQYLQEKFGIKDEESLRRHPEAIRVLKARNQTYRLMDDLGFEKMPEESYAAWLASLKEAAQKQEDAEIRKNIFND